MIAVGCCIVLTGEREEKKKTLLLLLVAAVQRKERGHLKTKLQLPIKARTAQVVLLCLRQFAVRSEKENVATKHAKYHGRMACVSRNYKSLIWSKSAAQRRI